MFNENETYIRKLPVYLLVDCSESMVGGPILAVSAGIDALVSELMKDPMAIETTWLSLITFSGKARQVVPLTECTKFRAPNLRIGAGTGLGQAINTLMDCINREVQKSSPTRKGDWKPIVYLLTDGQPTDDWRSAVARLKTFHSGTPINLIAVGCGDDVDVDILQALTPNVLLFKSYTRGDFIKFFKWVTASIRTASVSLSKEKVTLPSIPADVLDFQVEKVRRRPRTKPSQIIFAARCTNTRKPYLMRYKFDEGSELYHAEGSYPVGESYFEDGGSEDTGINIDVSCTYGLPPCPHCGNVSWGQCGTCGNLLCLPNEEGYFTCPSCGNSGPYYFSEGSFSVRQRLG